MIDKINSIYLIIGIVVGIITAAVGAITIWNWINAPYKLEAYILSTPAPLPPKLDRDIKAFKDFSFEDIRKRYKENNVISHVPDAIIKQAIPAFSEIIKDRIEMAKGYGLKINDYLNLLTLRNAGNKTINNIQISSKQTLNSLAIIDRGDNKDEVVEFTGILNIGKLSPQAELKVFVYESFPSIFEMPFGNITHDEGVAEVSVYQAVPKFIYTNGGIFISYYWTITILFILLLTILIFAVLIFYKKKSQNR
jgi:hypothetical protein